jgi:hypothetical protein
MVDSTLGQHSLGLFISLFDAWQQRCSLGVKFELKTFVIFAKHQVNMWIEM